MEKMCPNAIVGGGEYPLKSIMCKHTNSPCVCSYTLGLNPCELNGFWKQCPGVDAISDVYYAIIDDNLKLTKDIMALNEQIRVMSKELTRLRRLERRAKARYDKYEKMVWGEQ